MEDFKVENERCGEIFLSSSGVLFFVCSICDHTCEDYKNYLEHITKQHDFEFSFWDDVNNPIDIDEPTECIDFEDFSETNNDNVNDDEIFFGSGDSEDEIDKTRFDENDIDTEISTPAEICPKKDDEKEEGDECQANYEMSKCKQCEIWIKGKGNFAEHIQRHLEQHKRNICSLSGCGKRFFQRSELIQHLQLHAGKVVFTCKICYINFTSSNKLNNHMRRVHQEGKKVDVHMEERNFPCTHCKLRFKSRKTLLVHLKIHENKLEYKCHSCDARFNQRPTLNLHIKRKHPT